MVSFLNLNSVSFRVAILVGLLHFFIAVLVFFTLVDEPNHILFQQAKLKREAILLKQANLIEETLSPLKQNVNELQIRLEKVQKPFGNIAKSLLKPSESNHILFIADLEGNVYSHDEQWVSSYAQRFYVTRNPFQFIFRRTDTLDDGSWTNVFLDSHLQMYVIGYGVPIFDRGKIVGLAGGIIEVDELIEKVVAPSFSTNVNLFIHAEGGEIVFHPDYGLKLLRQTDNYSASTYSQSLLRPSLAQYIERIEAGQEVASFKDRDLNVYTDSIKVRDTNWHLVVYQTEKEILGPESHKSWTFIGFSTLTFFTIVMTVYWLSKVLMNRRIALISSPLSKWLRTYKNKEKSDVVQLLSTDDEFADLALELKKFISLESRNRQRLLEENNVLQLKVEENKALAQAISYSDNVVLLLSPDLLILQADAKCERLLAAEKGVLEGQPLFEFIHPHMDFIKEQILNQIRRKGAWVGELILRQSCSEEEIWVNCNITPMRSENGRIEKFVMTIQDISSVKDSQHKIEQLAYVDELTGLSNRAFFLAQLDKLLAISKRGRYDFALFYFDIDDFKKVNDFLGHEGGDKLLKSFSSKLGKLLRTEDVFARMGGDEFALITGGVKSQEDVIAKINQILDVAREPFDLFEHKVQVGVSIGVTMSSSDLTDADLLLQHADMAMYEAKSQGKNTYHFYSQDLNRMAKERIEIEQDMLFALENDELELHFQPKVDSRGPKLVGYESLLRWVSKKRGFVSPAEFIPVAEQSNLILKIGDWVLDKAAEFIKHNGQQVVVSINLSAKQFESGNLCKQLNKTIKKYDINPNLLEVEITESSLMIDIEGAIKQLHEIQKLGILISIDDFGTGYSSLSYLKRLPVTTLKIDRSFIKDIPEDENDMEITSAIIAMAKQLGLDVIAEGAETEEQVTFLREKECFYIQGYFYSKPLPKAEALEWVPPRL